MPASHFFTEVAGIIGGVGPEATRYLFGQIIERTSAERDQAHLPLLIFNNPQIPDRTAALVRGEASPLPELVHTAQALKAAGATFLAMPCNTAHAYAADLVEQAGLPLLHMIELTASAIAAQYDGKGKVGLLATDGTLATQIYQQAFGTVAPGIELLTPEADDQARVMAAIYDEAGIKAGYTDENNFWRLDSVARKLVNQGAEVVIKGCTEIPLALKAEKCDYAVIDPMKVLADAIIARTMASRVAD